MRYFITGINWGCDQETAEKHQLPESIELNAEKEADIFEKLHKIYGVEVNYIESITKNNNIMKEENCEDCKFYVNGGCRIHHANCIFIPKKKL